MLELAATVFLLVLSQAAGTEIHYVANSGMLVTVSGRRFLIDAPIRDGISPYPVSSTEERARLEGARPPYDRVDAILITHWHDGPVLHVGDADPAADNFTVLKPLPAVDVALLPFWYVSDESNRRFVANAIRPRRIVAMHAPAAYPPA